MNVDFSGPLFLHIHTAPDTARQQFWPDRPEEPQGQLPEPPTKDTKTAQREYEAAVKRVEKEQAKYEADRDKWFTTASVTPEFGAIIALGLASKDAPPIVGVVGAPNKYGDGDVISEADLLATFWRIYMSGENVGPVVTYNGLDFALPFVLVRSRLLGIETAPIDLYPWRNSQTIDLMVERFGRGRTLGPFRELAYMYGWKDPEGFEHTPPGDVQKLWANGHFAEVQQQLRVDVEMIRTIYRFYAGTFTADYGLLPWGADTMLPEGSLIDQDGAFIGDEGIDHFASDEVVEAQYAEI